MADLIRKPGVEISQVIEATPVTPVAPTLAPCVVGPAFEIVDALDENGSPQSSSQIVSLEYRQNGLVVAPSSFPSPHGVSPSELEYVRSSVDITLNNAGTPIALDAQQGSAFLSSLPSATRPAVVLKKIVTVGAPAVIQKVTIKRSGHLDVVLTPVDATLASFAAQINSDVAGVTAHVISLPVGADGQSTQNDDADALFITLSDASANYGSSAFIGLSVESLEDSAFRVFGSGLGVSNNAITYNRGSWNKGSFDAVGAGVANNSAIADADVVLPGFALFGFSSTNASADNVSIKTQLASVDFSQLDISTSSPTRRGDELYADGAVVGNISYVSATQIHISTLDVANSDFTAEGDPLNLRHRRLELNAGFSPRFSYIRAQDLNGPSETSTHAQLTLPVGATPAVAAKFDLEDAALGDADAATTVAVLGKSIVFALRTNGVLGANQTISFDDNYASADTLKAAIDLQIQNGFISGVVVSAAGNKVTITHSIAGAGNDIVLFSAANGSTALPEFATAPAADTYLGVNAVLGALANTSLHFYLDNNPYTYVAGPFVDGDIPGFIGEINQTAGANIASYDAANDNLILRSVSVGRSSRIEIDAFAPIAAAASSNNGTGRPNPDLFIGLDSSAHIGSQIVRDLRTGLPRSVSLVSLEVHVSYRALRRDVSPAAADPGLLKFSSLTDLQNTLGPLTAENPLGLGLYYAMLNADSATSGLEVSAIGVSDISDAEPEGTQLAYLEAIELLRAHEVYAIAPLTSSEQVIEALDLHVSTMSSPENKGERVLISAPRTPSRAVNIVALSGSTAEYSALNAINLGATPVDALQAQGVDTNSDIPFELPSRQQLYLQFTYNGEVLRYSVARVSDAVISLRTQIPGDGNSDGFYTELPFNSSDAESLDFTLVLRGAPLTNALGLLNKTALAESVRDRAKQYNNRRQLRLFPDTVQSVIGGIESRIPSYYFACAISGRTASLSAETPFSRRSMLGFTNVIGPDLEPNHLNIISAGNAVIEVENPGLAPSLRIQSTTAPDAIETREYSIVKAVDQFAKTLRVALKNRVGLFNLTQAYLDDTATIVDSICTQAVENGLLANATVTKMQQSKDSPDTLLVEVNVSVLYPANYIKLTIVV